MPRNVDLHIPTDLLGVTPGTYEPNRQDGNLRAAVGPFCNELKKKFPKPLPYVYPEETIARWNKLSEDVMEAYRLAITRSRKLPYKISPEELNDLSIFELDSLYQKTEFSDTDSIRSMTCLILSTKSWLERGIPAKPWDIDRRNDDENEIREDLSKIRESIK